MKTIGTSLAERVRAALSGRRAITEKKMFGGICFLLRGHMLCGTGKHGFMFRVGRDQPRRCDARALKRWIVLAEGYVGMLPPKRRSR